MIRYKSSSSNSNRTTRTKPSSTSSSRTCQIQLTRLLLFVLVLVSSALSRQDMMTMTKRSANKVDSSINSSGNSNSESFEACSEIEIRSWTSLTLDDDEDELLRLDGDDREEEDGPSRMKMTGTTTGVDSLHLTMSKERILKNRQLQRIKVQKRKQLHLAINKVLGKIDDLSRGIGADLCTTPSRNNNVFPTIPIGTHVFNVPKEKANLIAYFISSNGNSILPSFPSSGGASNPPRGSNDRHTKPIMPLLPGFQKIETIFEALYQETQVYSVRFIEFFPNVKANQFMYERKSREQVGVHRIPTDTDKLATFPWYFDPSAAIQSQQQSSSSGRKEFLQGNFMRQNETLDAQLERIEASRFQEVSHLNVSGFWSWPWFQCVNDNNYNEGLLRDENERGRIQGRWMVSYSVAFLLLSDKKNQPMSYGLLSFDVDLTEYPINQCGFVSEEEYNADLSSNPLFAFRETHKCNSESAECHFHRLSLENGWRKGNYDCLCKPNHYAYYPDWNNTINGVKAESVWCKKVTNATFSSGESKNSPSFQELVSCSLCPDECPNCTDGKSCMAEMSVVFRLILLCISIICSVGTFGLIIVVYKFRKLPILKNSSPIFLCICLVGCIIMYSEMIVLFPKLRTGTCIAVKWTRHLGFCITYTCLYMKLCRVYLTYRVKSAHKIKLTEKHLLHWMSPIMVIMLLYLFAWTISDPPAVDILNTWNDKKFSQCKYNWWDHALAIGEFIFLTYGVWICWRIRENPDAQFISYSIYNIAVVNTVFASVHLMIAPKAGPDLKYLFAFLRTQLSTTVTIALVLGSRLYHIARGDTASKKEIASSLNGFGHETLDLAEENQQLKEELQKMATQMERLKSYAMCKNNPHLKSSSGHVTIDKEFGRLDSFTAL